MPTSIPPPPGVIVLGSASPRRREILESRGASFVVHVAAIDEAVHPGEDPDGYLTRVVRAKLVAVRAGLPADVRGRAKAILVADTSVIVGGAILGKPADADEACAMIERLAGRTHEVHTRFTLAGIAAESPIHEETVVTRVTMRSITHARALAYAASGEGMDKAGGYAVQGRAAAFVRRIEGSYANVVGLPACEVAVALEARGLR